MRKLALLGGMAATLCSVGLYTETKPELAYHRGLSRAVGRIFDTRIPSKTMREKLYKAFGGLYGVKFDEVERPLDSYESFGDFFARKLKPGVRPIDSDADMVSPVDGRVLVFGKVDKANGNTLEQIKGQTYELDEFLGDDWASICGGDGRDDATDSLYYCVIYLAPGDYHRVHSPVDWTVHARRHFPGLLWSVSPAVVKRAERLFVRNERVVLLGQWRHGFFSLSPIGATNVGSIALTDEPELRTNLPINSPEQARVDERVYEQPIENACGDELARFHAGSTVVLIFHSPADFEFNVEPHQAVQLGQSIGRILD